MATSTITGSILDPEGTPLQWVVVKCRLRPRPAFETATGDELSLTAETVTDANGEYSFDLVETADITPAGSTYEITEEIPSRYGGAVKHVIQVGASNTSVLASKVSSPPAPVTQTFLTQDAADARYVQSPATFGGAPDIEPVVIGDTADAGSIDEYARIDHQHAHAHGSDLNPLLPWGKVGYATVTANPSTFSSITDLTGASVTFTAVAGRDYKITAQALFVISTNTTQCSLSVRDGSNVQQQAVVSESVAASGIASCQLVVKVSPGAGSVTYKLSAARQSGSGTLTTSIDSSRPDFILIEDIGPS